MNYSRCTGLKDWFCIYIFITFVCYSQPCYYVVEFQEELANLIATVSSEWLDLGANTCYWPPEDEKMSASKYTILHKQPVLEGDKKWTLYSVTIFQHTKTSMYFKYILVFLALHKVTNYIATCGLQSA
jgi:hypothetical protein